MSASRRGALARDGLASRSCLGARDIAWGASIVAVRVWPADDYTRVTIESDARARRRATSSPPRPTRLVIDVDGLELSPQLRELVGKVRADDPFIAGVRVGQNQPRVVRLVIDLKQPTAPAAVHAGAGRRLPHRLVFDLLSDQGARPAARADPRREQAETEGGAVGAGRARRIHRPGRRRGRRGVVAGAASPRRRAPALGAARRADGAAVRRLGAAGRAARPARRRCRRRSRRRRSIASSSSRSIPATAARTRARAARAACTRRTSCWRSRCSCATASTPTRTCARC